MSKWFGDYLYSWPGSYWIERVQTKWKQQTLSLEEWVQKLQSTYETENVPLLAFWRTERARYTKPTDLLQIVAETPDVRKIRIENLERVEGKILQLESLAAELRAIDYMQKNSMFI
jgi:hypothetical protein